MLVFFLFYLILFLYNWYLPVSSAGAAWMLLGSSHRHVATMADASAGHAASDASSALAASGALCIKNSIKLKKINSTKSKHPVKKKTAVCIHPSSVSLRGISIKHWIQTTRFSRLYKRSYIYLEHKKIKLNIFEWKSDYLLLKTSNSRQENLIADLIREISVNIYVLFCFCFPIRLCGRLFVERSWVLTFRRVVTRKRNV